MDVHLATCVKVIQDIVTEHRELFPGCVGRNWGVSALIKLKCNTCNFVSSKNFFFREVPHVGKGRKAAEPNRSLALGLCNKHEYCCIV